MKVKFKKLSDTAKVPKRADGDSAGYDLYSDVNGSMLIKAHSSEAVPTNIAVHIPEGFFGAIYARSGLAFRNGIRPVNCTGIVDSGFHDGIKVGLRNDSDEDFIVTQNMRIAQLILQKFEEIDFVEVEDLGESERGLNGFGSTGLD